MSLAGHRYHALVTTEVLALARQQLPPARGCRSHSCCHRQGIGLNSDLYVGTRYQHLYKAQLLRMQASHQISCGDAWPGVPETPPCPLPITLGADRVPSRSPPHRHLHHRCAPHRDARVAPHEPTGVAARQRLHLLARRLLLRGRLHPFLPVRLGVPSPPVSSPCPRGARACACACACMIRMHIYVYIHAHVI